MSTNLEEIKILFKILNQSLEHCLENQEQPVRLVVLADIIDEKLRNLQS